MKYFGTDGIRVKVDKNINESLFIRLGDYFSFNKRKKILLGMDTRNNGAYIKSLLLSGLLKGCEVTDVGVISTPGLSYLLSKNDFDFGIMVSASHNPSFYNGIKILNSKGSKISYSTLNAIEKFIDSNKKCISFNGKYTYKPGLIRDYEEFLIRSFYIDNDLKIAVDCSNGATSLIAKHVFSYFDLNVFIFNEEGEINHKCGVTNINNIKNIVKKTNSDLGIVFDGDGDRLHLIYKNQVIDGDDLLLFFAKKLNKNVVINELTRKDTIENLIKMRRKIKKVKVGDSHIAAYLSLHPSFIGGETSGHLIVNKDHNSGDGLFNALFFLSFIKRKEDLEKAFIKKKYLYLSLSYKKTEKMNDPKYISSLKEKYIKLSKDKYVKFRLSGTEDVLRVIIESKTKKEEKEKIAILNDLIK